VKGALAREFYHAEALRGGWSVRQLDRQIASQFYERIALSRNKNSMLRKGAVARAGDSVSADEEVRNPQFPRLSTLNNQLRKGAWLPRSFTLSTFFRFPFLIPPS
jgi:hypothetical protein